MFNQGTNNAPSAESVIPYFVLSAISWLVALVFIAFHPNSILSTVYFNEIMLTITHILVLGFVTSVIFGALFQLLPVIFLQKIYSESITKAIFYLLLFGTVGLCSSFYFGGNGIGLTFFGSLLNLAVLLFIINVWKTIGKSKENKVARLFIKTSAVWLSLTTIAGLLLAINFIRPFLPFVHIELLKIHAHFGIIGWFLFLIIGVSSVLIPMFLLVHKPDCRPLYFSYVTLMTALILGGVSKLMGVDMLMYFAYGFGGLGIVYFLNFIYVVYKTRPRKKLDYGLKKTMLAFPVLIIVIISGVFFISGFKTDFNLSAFYVIVLIFGFIATLILGQFYKTLPFIVWLKTYKPFVGKEKTLLPKDLYNYTILKFQFYTHVSGFMLFFSGILFQLKVLFFLGISLLIIGAVLFLINVMLVVLHKRKVPMTNLSTVNITEMDVYKSLKNVIDPELYVNIVDLGLVYGVKLTKNPLMANVKMTLTSKGCPMGDAIIQDVKETLMRTYSGLQVSVELVWDPGWSMEMVSDEGQRELNGM